MARTKNEDLPRRRKCSGDRLKEVMELRGYTPKKFLMEMKKKYGFKDETSEGGYHLEGLDRLATLSRIRSGILTLQNNHARMAAEILKIDVNYLLGTIDDFKASSYYEYLDNIDFYRNILDDTQRVIPEQERIRDEYHKALSPYGIDVTGMSAVGDRIDDFDITSDGRTITISAAEMELLYQKIKKYIQIRVDLLAMEHGANEDIQEGR